ncbi:MAG: hypothetical protein PHS38_11120 [Bacteroidales bacterium]|nr:hypothetical protein [Bacteroidales bacterium]
MRWEPIHFYPLFEIFRIHKKKKLNLTFKTFKTDAEKRIDTWKKEFSISDYSDPISLINKDRMRDSAHVLSEIIAFCNSRNFVPIVVFPPLSDSLSIYFTPEIKQKYIYDWLTPIIEDRVVFLDYSDDTSLKDMNLYYDSFCLNKKGSELFSSRVLDQIGNL